MNLSHNIVNQYNGCVQFECNISYHLYNIMKNYFEWRPLSICQSRTEIFKLYHRAAPMCLEYFYGSQIIVKKLKRYGYNNIIANMSDNNSNFSIRNKTLNSRPVG